MNRHIHTYTHIHTLTLIHILVVYALNIINATAAAIVIIFEAPPAIETQEVNYDPGDPGGRRVYLIIIGDGGDDGGGGISEGN